jgi:methylated-DNA-[protein]-cysteine S-methyltransferase
MRVERLAGQVSQGAARPARLQGAAGELDEYFAGRRSRFDVPLDSRLSHGFRRTNSLPVVVPCHRVVRSDGTIGQYAGGADVKRALLALEAAA